MIQKKEFVLQGSKGKPILLDISFSENQKQQQPTILFCHGFKGFKDWGTFNLIAEEFVRNGFVFVKFNFSHNGTTLGNPTDFVDVEGFGNNNFMFELTETKSVIDFLVSHENFKTIINPQKISIIGHSRGGGTAILAGAQHSSIQKIIGWAPVHEFLNYWEDDVVENWKKEGVMWVNNSRTGQRLPMYYQYWENYSENLELLHIPTHIKNLKKPMMVLHGKKDEALDFKFSENMKTLNSEYVEVKIYENMNHTFGGKHPWLETQLPSDTQTIIKDSIAFLQA